MKTLKTVEPVLFDHDAITHKHTFLSAQSIHSGNARINTEITGSQTMKTDVRDGTKKHWKKPDKLWGAMVLQCYMSQNRYICRNCDI